MRPEVITILKALNNKNSSDLITIEKRVVKALTEKQDLEPLIDELKNEIASTKDSNDTRAPFYNFYLSILLLKNDKTKEAKSRLSEAIHGFHILGWEFNKAMSEWLFSTIHFENEQYERAQRGSDSAIAILKSEIRRQEFKSNYEAAREIAAYLAQLDILQDNIDVAIHSDTFLKKQRDKLDADIKYLTNQGRRIRPTFIANYYYLSKILLMPAPYVYPAPTEPVTEWEKRIYEDLLDKVGAYQIIERLIAQEQELAPAATRAELLYKVNLAWDKDTRR